MNLDTCECCKFRPGLCHGTDGDWGVAGCVSFDHRRCKELGWTCLCDPAQLAYRLREAGGFDCSLRGRLRSTPSLPHYVPTIYNRVSPSTLFKLDWIAVPLHVLFARRGDGPLEPFAKTAEELRTDLGVHRTTKIALTGPGPDQTLEDFWRFHRTEGLLAQLLNLEVDLFTVPNYSFFLDSPPLHYRYNRSRILRVTERASEAGLGAVLHLNALHEEEWRDWERLITAHAEITQVCLEFQTGYSRPAIGAAAIERLVRLRDNVGRPLHPIIIGGARFAVELGQHFKESCTVIDAQPFLRTFYRRHCWVDSSGRLRWKFKRSQPGEDLGGRFTATFQTYAHRIEQRLKGQRPVLQAELGFKPDNAGPLRPPGRQRSLAALPLFENGRSLPQADRLPESRFRCGPPSSARVRPQNSAGTAPSPPRGARAASRANSDRKSTPRTRQPSASDARNTRDATSLG